jgi:fluoroquinolone transport system permease protein
MNRWIALTLGDIKQIKRDPVLIACMAAPIVLILFLRFVLPWINSWLLQLFSLNLESYRELILSFFSLLIPGLSGILAGFVMLDERDEQLIAYYAVTPLSKRGYILYRLAIPSLISFLFSLLFLLMLNNHTIQLSGIMAISIMLAAEAPFYALCLISLANNKIEGMAISKMLGLLYLAPFVAYFLFSPWQWITGIIPTYWPGKLFLSTADGSEDSYILFLIGMIVHLIWVLLLLRRFLNKIES